jgi:hypothetical protein
MIFETLIDGKHEGAPQDGRDKHFQNGAWSRVVEKYECEYEDYKGECQYSQSQGKIEQLRLHRVARFSCLFRPSLLA